MEQKKWKMRKECRTTYFIELESDDGIIAVFTDKPEKTEKVARLIAAAPDLLTACKAFINLFNESDMRPEDECHDLYVIVDKAIAAAQIASS